MQENLSELIENVLEGIHYCLGKYSKLDLGGMDVLQDIKSSILVYKNDKNLEDLRSGLIVYRESNILFSGNTDYDSVWFKDIEVSGKTTTLSYLLDSLDNLAWDKIKENSGE